MEQGRLPNQNGKHGAQTEIFPDYPRIMRAVFARLGGLHRNTFLSTVHGSWTQRSGSKPTSRLRFAGQITGVEGYVESAAIGLIAGRLAAGQWAGRPLGLPPFPTTALGALVSHITGGHLHAGAGSPSSR